MGEYEEALQLKDDISAKINELLEEKKRIDEQLKNLRDIDVYSGCVKMGVRKPPKHLKRCGASETYTLSFQYENEKGYKMWYPVFKSESKQGIVDVIPAVITDLQDLRRKIEGEQQAT